MNKYKKMDTREGGRDIYKLSFLKRKNSSHLGNIRCLKSKDHRFLVAEMRLQKCGRCGYITLIMWKTQLYIKEWMRHLYLRYFILSKNQGVRCKE